MQGWLESLAADVVVSQPVAAQTPDTVPGRAVAIDGDFLCYWAGGGPNPAVAREVLRNKVEKFKRYSGAEHAYLCMTADGSLKGDRYLVAKTKPYQAQRKGTKPVHWALLRELCISNQVPGARTMVFTDREADDAMVYMAQHHGAVIVTKDKDMRWSWGLHLTWDEHHLVTVQRDEYHVVAYDKEYGYRWFLKQMLMGDTVDNIPGLGNKTGPKTADKILENTLTAEEGTRAVCDAYAKAYNDKWADRFVEQAILLWIRPDRDAKLASFWDYMPHIPEYKSVIAEAIDRVTKRVQEQHEEARRFAEQADAARAG